MTPEQSQAKAFLDSAGLFFGEDEEVAGMDQVLNMNDTWAWASADGEQVPNEELLRVKELFCRYGYCGVLYWVSERRNRRRSEFCDVNRFVEFVSREESIRAEEPNSSKRACMAKEYTIGRPCDGDEDESPNKKQSGTFAGLI